MSLQLKQFENNLLDERSKRYCSNGAFENFSLSAAIWNGISSLEIMSFSRLSSSFVDLLILFEEMNVLGLDLGVDVVF